MNQATNPNPEITPETIPAELVHAETVHAETAPEAVAEVKSAE